MSRSMEKEQPKGLVGQIAARMPKLPQWKPTETDKLKHTLDEASKVMSEVELLLEEIEKCEEKLSELEGLKRQPRKVSRIPILRHLLNASRDVETADLESQITAYRSILAGLNGHLLQIVLHQCKDYLFLGNYLYPVAVSELKNAITSGAAENLNEAIALYENTLARWTSSGTEQGTLKKQRYQATRMAKLLKEARTM